jgi:hypothetical protein
MIKTIRKIFASIQMVDNYLETKKLNGAKMDRRITKIFHATMDGEQGWFLDLVRKNPECALNVIKECDLNDESD